MNHLATRRHLWYAISLIAIIPGVVSLALFGLRQGIDFTGGTLWELRFDQSIESETVADVFAENGYNDTVIQISSDDGTDNVAVVRMKELREGSPEKTAIEEDLRATIGDFTELQISTVGASVGNEIRDRAVIAVVLASVGILLYIAYAFRNTQNPVLYGICAIVGMLHDVLLVVGIFSILGEVANVEIDALFVTAVLTVIGFSVHDTIVVFDRIRENLANRAAPTFLDVVNYSLAQTIVRSLNNSITVVFTLLALFLFGGESTQEFVLALLIGVISGTYSSIFNASQLLVSWETGEIHRLFGRTHTPDAETLAAPTR
ncbi:MAG: protein translocase subunit SecF [Thermomicrobiales bacterium]